ncbi:DUF5985 family protein [Aquabacterium sp. J223]|uniref:DUF5985 family protein n=1 Tax=Aquabacterium sp. J223 TaxID=2898431 RepID=UPI0021ADCB18|nr:DUF5985 family protein [Aquabacterium sp. J223]UUX94757.1 DUF5985 family protein [Aquabacterium sp. J223]
MLAAVIYTLCASTAALAATLLLRSFVRSRHRLLLWSGLCFVGLTLNNVLLVVDRLILPTEVDLGLARLLSALAAVLLLVVGLVMEHEA